MIDDSPICCCRAIVWTKFIAGLQMGICVISIGYCINQLTQVERLEEEEAKKGTIIIDEKVKKYVVAYNIIGIVQCILTIGFAILLLVGANKRKTGCLVAWMVFTVITTITYIVLTILNSHTFGKVGVTVISHCVVTVAIRSFGLLVVYQLKRQIEAGGSLGNGLVFAMPMDGQKSMQEYNRNQIY